MIEKASALFSVYVLDGIQQELTPARLLEAVSEEGVLCGGQDDTPAVVVDETIESVGRSVVPVSEDPFPFLGMPRHIRVCVQAPPWWTHCGRKASLR